ncbi:MAG: MATE family efflux transporter [Bacillota bacterium]
MKFALAGKKIPNHLLVAAGAWGGRIVSAAVQLVSVRLLVEGLGAGQYAVFAVLTSLNGWFTLADFGMGAGLQNYISESRAREEDHRPYVAAAGFLAVIAFILVLLALYLLSPFLSHHLLVNLYLPEGESANRLFLVAGAIFTCTATGGISYRIWYAYQKGYYANIFPAMGALAGLAGVWLAAGRAGKDNILLICLAVFHAPVAIAAAISFVVTVLPAFKKAGPTFFFPYMLPLLKRGVKFWVFGLMAAGVLQIDYIVMSQKLAPGDITSYNIVSKIYAFIFFIYNAVLAALWPVCAEYLAVGLRHEVKKIVQRYILYGFSIIAFATGGLLLFMPLVLKVIAPTQVVSIANSTILLFGVYFILRVWTDTFAMALQSMSDLYIFWLCVPIQAILSLSLQWSLSGIYGVNGIVLGLIGSFLLTVFWVLPWKFYRNLKCIH